MIDKIIRRATQLFNLNNHIEREIAADWVEQTDFNDETVTNLTAAAIRTMTLTPETEGDTQERQDLIFYNGRGDGYNHGYGEGAGYGSGDGNGQSDVYMYNDEYGDGDGDGYGHGYGCGHNSGYWHGAVVGYGYGCLIGCGGGFGRGTGLSTSKLYET